MALEKVKAEGGHKRGANDRWCYRAIAKQSSKKIRRRLDKKEAQLC